MKIFSMRKTTITKVAVIALLGFALHGCKKPSNGIDNNQVIVTPYSLFLADSSGVIYNTNDGINYKNLAFGADGSFTKALCTSGNNLLMVRADAYVRVGTNINFNPAGASLNPLAFSQSLILDVPKFHRIYLAGTLSATGVSYSDSNGKEGTWMPDNDDHITSKITSYTQLQNGTVVGYSDVNKQTFTVTSTSARWNAVTVGTALPASGNFFISHLQNMLVAADWTGANGVWYSTNMGADWTAFTGIPNIPIASMCSAFDQSLLVGTYGGGVYRLTANSTSFNVANSGLGSNLKVMGITTKYDVYKNGSIKQYVFLATNEGIYKSEDLGLTWVLIKSLTLPESNFVAIY